MSDNSYLIQKQEDFCVRCRTRPGLYTCNNCDGLNFCDQCDFYVHSVSSKKQHQRTHISQISEKLEIKDKSQSEQNFYKSNNNLSQCIYNEENKTPFLNTNNIQTYEQNINNININHSRISTNPTTLYDLTNKSINKFSLNSMSSRYRSTSNEKLYEKKDISSSGPFSREYIQEMKNFHEKEKRELLLKNNNLLESIDTMKREFQKQISDLQIQIEESHKKNQLSLTLIEEENQMKIKKIINDKENELKIVYTKLKEQDEINQKLICELNEKTDLIQEIKYKYHEKFNELDYNICQNEKEFLNMKQFYEDRINYLESHYNEEKKILIKKYEENIENLIKGHNRSKEKLNFIIKERENEVNSVIEKTNNEQKNLKDSLADLKKLIEEEKQAKNELVNQLGVKNSEIEILNRNIEKLKKDNKDFLNQIKLFENENKGLIDEKEDLKGKLSKFDRIVYGKLKKK